MLATCSVAKQKFNLLFRCCLISLVTKRRGICAMLTANDFNVESLRPDVELLDSRGAKSVCGREHGRVAGMHEVMRQLCRRRCFAGSVHANNQNHGWFSGRLTNWRRVARQNPRDLSAHCLDHIPDSQQSPSLAFLEGLDDSHRHRHTETGPNE